MEKSKMEKIVKLRDIIFDLQMEELDVVSSMLRDRRKALGNTIKYSLNIGDEINVNDLGVGVITKINRTRCLAKFDKGSYNVPFSLITKE